MAYLFAKDVVVQSLRLGFAGAWRQASPDLQDPLELIRQHCPELTESFLPPSERTIDAIAFAADKEGDNVQQDALHQSVKVSIKGFVLTHSIADQLQLRHNTSLGNLSAAHLFIQQLQQAFHQDYGIRNIVHFRKRQDKLHWCQRVSFTTPGPVPKRWTLKVGNYFYSSTQQISCRVQQLAIVTFQRRKYLFFIATQIEQVLNEGGIPVIDPILRMDILEAWTVSCLWATVGCCR